MNRVSMKSLFQVIEKLSYVLGVFCGIGVYFESILLSGNLFMRDGVICPVVGFMSVWVNIMI